MIDKLCDLLNIDQFKINEEDSATFLISRYGFNDDKDESTSCCVEIDKNETIDDTLPPDTIQNVAAYLNITEDVNYQVEKQPEPLPAFVEIRNIKRKKGERKEQTKLKDNKKTRIVNDNPNDSLFSSKNIVREIVIGKN